MKVIERDMTRNCSRKDLDWMLGNMRFRIDLLIIGICCLSVALILALLTLSRNTSGLNLILESEAVKFVSCGSRYYTSKACAYSSPWRHAGVCEFGELSNLVKPKNFNLLSYFQLSIPRTNFVALLWTLSISLIIFRQVWIPIAAHREILSPTHH